MNDLTQRTQRTVESILENERLTADLDDVAAQVLLDWSIAWATMVAQDTAGLNDTEAEEAMYPRLRALRRMMRVVNRWVNDVRELDSENSTKSLETIIDHAATIYGAPFIPPTNEQCGLFVQQQAVFANNAPQLITNLRVLLERTTESPSNQEEPV